MKKNTINNLHKLFMITCMHISILSCKKWNTQMVPNQARSKRIFIGIGWTADNNFMIIKSTSIEKKMKFKVYRMTQTC